MPDAIEFLNDNSGAVSAVATVVLVGVTAAYVILTSRLVRAQYAPVKRELVEVVYAPLSNTIRTIMNGASPRLHVWSTLKNEQPFLTNHHLMPVHLRRTLDALAIKLNEAESGDFEALREHASRAAARVLGYEVPEEAFSVRVLMQDVWSSSIDIVRFVVPVHPPRPQHAQGHKPFLTPQITIRLRDASGKESGQSSLAKALEFSDYEQFVVELQNEMGEREEAYSALQRYRTLMAEAGHLRNSIIREISRGSHV